MLESQPSLKSDGVDASSSSLTSCLNRAPGCGASAAWERPGAVACHWTMEEKCLSLPQRFGPLAPPNNTSLGSPHGTRADLASVDSERYGI